MEKGLKKELYSHFTLGDMVAIYLKNERGGMELVLVPSSYEEKICGGLSGYEYKISRGDSLIQAKLIGDQYPTTLSGGQTMRNTQTTADLKLVSQEAQGGVIKTVMTDGKQHTFIHYLKYTEGDLALESVTEMVNESDKPAVLELLSSFSLSEITPFSAGEALDAELKVHRVRSKWSHEGRLVTTPIEDLQLEVSWTGWHVASERYGSVGSMPVRTWFPFGAVEDSTNEVVWGAQLMIESSWEMEFYRRDEALAFSGGIADREFGAWTKTVNPGETFTTPSAILTVCAPTAEMRSYKKGEKNTNLIDYAGQRMTQFINKFVEAGPESEQSLPVLFNEYCTTWGLPSYENIDGILKAIKGHGLEYFVIDCGWFVEEGKHWGDGMGDYIPSDILFPNGLKSMSDRIREDGLKPGIWFEIDNVGHDSHAYSEKEELLHTRDGEVLTTMTRKFFDMRKPETIQYLDEKVIKQLNEYGFEYMKMDYNDNIGLGVDSPDGLGEGLRADREASVEFVRKVKREVPGIILENCASGGHRLEPLMMSICSMASFSDAHECEHIPAIAGGLHRTILPRQSQIWAVIRKTDETKRIAWTLINTMLGRMCFSGDVTELTDEQWNCIDNGIAFYKAVAPIIKNGYTFFDDHKGLSDKKLSGYQAYIREATDPKLDTTGTKEALVTVHMYDVEEDCITIPLPQNCPGNIAKVYSGTAVAVNVEKEDDVFVLKVNPEIGKMEGVAVLLSSNMVE